VYTFCTLSDVLFANFSVDTCQGGNLMKIVGMTKWF